MTGGRRETKRRVKDKSAEERYRRERAKRERAVWRRKFEKFSLVSSGNCLSCGNMCFAWRKECNKCNQPRL